MEILNENEFKERIKSEKIVLVDFFANWCGPCKMLGPILESVEKEVDLDIFDFIKIDIDECEELARKYGVMSIPTMIIFKNGEEIDRMIGLRQKSQIIDALSAKLS